ncbi:MAG: alpha/beta hydrolase [Actinobacteria bacterium]|nr:alpha/beta hydrolase [Actinomycetota bacterium]
MTNPSERVDYAQVGDHRVAYDTFGDPDHPTLLMVMGLGAQLVHWDPVLCNALADRGFHIVRFDNRDIGLSTHYPDGPPPRIVPIALGFRSTAPYRMSDFAADAVGLLDHLGVEQAHVVGASLGGAIVQTMAIEHPHRILTMTSVMGPTGSTFAELPRLRILPSFLKRTPPTVDGAIDTIHAFNRTISSPGWPFDAERDREKVATAYARAFDPPGVQRQLAAMLASGSRRKALRGVKVPTLVIHGAEDPLVPVRAARAIARAVPDARLEIVEGMGHDAPVGLWPHLVDLLAEHARSRSDERTTDVTTTA